MKKWMTKTAAFILSGAIVLTASANGAFAGLRAAAEEEGTPSSLGASAACDGLVLGTFSGVPACVNGNGDLHICENNFPDEKFRELILGRRDAKDGYLTAQEIEKTTSIGYQSNHGIKNVKGIEFFSEFKQFAFSYNRLTKKLDLSNNSKLESVIIP